MSINIEGCGVSKSWTRINQGRYYFIDNFPETGMANYTIKISFKEVTDQLKIITKTKSDSKKVTTIFIPRLATITTKDVKNWVNYGITDVYVQTRVAQKDTAKLKQVINLCKNTNVKVHAWVICLKTDNGWDYSTTQQNKVISFIKDTIKIKGINGICLDYVRYSGVNPNITKPGVITNFVKNINNAIKSYDKKLILSACLFAEKENTTILYGQDYTALDPYLDYILPMEYKYDYNETRTWITEATEYVVERTFNAKIVPVIQSYKQINGKTYTLSKSELEADALAAMNGGADGYSLFRYGLIGKYPQNAEILWKNK